MNWKYKIKNGSALREAIDNEDVEQVVKCLLSCCIELNRKLRGEDKSNYTLELDDIFTGLTCLELDEDEEENEEVINNYLYDFYDICDDVKAFVEL